MSQSQPWIAPNDDRVAEILKTAVNVAIVGISDKPGRASNDIAQYLAANSKYRLFFVNPLLESFMGKKVFDSLSEIAEPLDIVDVFRKTSDLPEVFQDAFTISPKAIWLQLGISDETLANEAKDLGIEVVMDRCIKVEHRRLLG